MNSIGGLLISAPERWAPLFEKGMELMSSEVCLPLGIASGRLGSPSLLKITKLFLMHSALAEKNQQGLAIPPVSNREACLCLRQVWKVAVWVSSCFFFALPVKPCRSETVGRGFENGGSAAGQGLYGEKGCVGFLEQNVLFCMAGLCSCRLSRSLTPCFL